MELVLLGMGISIAVISIVAIVYWIKYHHEVINSLKQKLESVEDAVENAHKYFDQRIEHVHSNLTEDNYNVHRRLEENTKEIHDRIDGEVKIIEDRISDEIGNIQIGKDISNNEMKRQLNNVFSEINQTNSN